MEPKNKYVAQSLTFAKALVTAIVTGVVVKLMIYGILSIDDFSRVHNPRTCSTVIAVIFGLSAFAVDCDNPPKGSPPRDSTVLLESLAYTIAIVGFCKLLGYWVLVNEPDVGAQGANTFTTVVAAPVGIVFWCFTYLEVWDGYHNVRKGY